MLARSRLLLFKIPEQWSETQQQRAEILFNAFPLLKQAYDLSIDFRALLNKENIPLSDGWSYHWDGWYNKVEDSKITEMMAFAKTVDRNVLLLLYVIMVT